MTYDIHRSTNLADWFVASSLTITNPNGTASIPVSIPAEGPQKFYRAIAR